MFVRFSKLDLEFLPIILRSKLGAELLCTWSLIGNIMSSPSPSIITGFHLLQFTENVFGDDIVIDDTLMSLISTHQHPNITQFLMLQQTQVANSSLLPLIISEAIDFSTIFSKFIFLLLTCHCRHFRQINYCPVPNYFLLDIFVLIISGVLFLVVLWFWVFCFEH